MESVVFQRNNSVSDQEQKPMPRIAFRPLVLIAVLALMAVIVGAQAPVPQPEDQETAQGGRRAGRTKSHGASGH